MTVFSVATTARVLEKASAQPMSAYEACTLFPVTLQGRVHLELSTR